MSKPVFKIIMITENFPFGDGELPFVFNEYTLLSERFDVTVFPARDVSRLPLTHSRVSFERDLSIALSQKSRVFVSGALEIGKLLVSSRKFRRSFSLQNFWQNLSELGRAFQCRKYFSSYISDTDNNILFYSFWSFGASYGAASIETRGRVQPVSVSRIAGHDFIAERGERGYLAWLGPSLGSQSKVICSSKYARDYVLTRFPEVAPKLTVGYLTSGKHFLQLNSPPPGHEINIVSCSTDAPVKRVPLILDVMVHLAQLASDRKVNWLHMGPVSPEIACLPEGFPRNLSVEYAGSMTNFDVHRQYVLRSFSAFIHLSESEGGVPLAVQEAMSYGVPIAGYNSAGTAEAVGLSQGILFQNSCPNQISQELLAGLDAPDYAILRKSAYSAWEKNFDPASQNISVATLFQELLEGRYSV